MERELHDDRKGILMSELQKMKAAFEELGGEVSVIDGDRCEWLHATWEFELGEDTTTLQSELLDLYGIHSMTVDHWVATKGLKLSAAWFPEEEDDV